MKKGLPIFYSALMLTGVNLLLRFVGTGFQVYLSGRIGAAGVGLLQLVLSVGMLAMTVGMAGIRTAAMYLTAEELGKKQPGNVRWVLSGCFLYSIIGSGGIAVFLSIFAPQIAEYWIGDARVAGSLQLFAAFLPVSCLCGVMTGYFTAAGRIGILAAVEVAEQLFSMLVTVLVLTFYSGTSPSRACQAVILGSGAGTCLTLVLLTVLRFREHAAVGTPVPLARRLLKTAVPLALADDLKSGINTTENLMVPKRLRLYPGTGDPLAAFGMVCGMVFPILMFPAAILFGLAELLIPELARCAAAGSHKRISYLAGRSLRVAMLYGCIVGALVYLLSDRLCLWLYDSREAGAYLRRFSLLIPMLYCDAITDATTKGLGQQTACVRYNILTSFLDVIFLYLLLPRYGIDGYFFSFLVTHLLNFILSLRRLLKITNMRLPLRVPVLTLLSTGVAIWGAGFLPSEALQSVVCIVILLCMLFLLHILNKEDLLWVSGLVRGHTDRTSSKK